MNRTLRASALTALLFLAVFAGTGLARAEDNGCLDALKAVLKAGFAKADAMVGALEAFAREHNLPMKAIEVGPASRRVKRLVVGLDIKNEALMKAYRERFNLTANVGGEVKGTLALE